MNDGKYLRITDEPDYRHLEDRDLYKALYEEVGTVEANRDIQWREEWMKHFHPKAGSRILELGAHNGPNLIHYGRQGHVVHGVELSNTLADTFMAYLLRESVDVQNRICMYRGWIEDFRPDGQYDHVLCTEILEHVKDPVAILKIARQALQSGGTMYISSPSSHWGNNTHVRGVPPDDLKRWLKTAGLNYAEIWEEDGRTFCIAHSLDLKVIGLLRVRNEAAIIRDTLEHMARFCSGGIYVYDDVSSDATPEICRMHPSVRDVVIGEFWDGNRGRANYANRAAVLARAKRDARPQDWFVYMDADERIDFEWCSLISLPADVLGVRMKLFDFYITEEDNQKDYNERKYIGPEFRQILMAFKNLPTLSYWVPGTREVDLGALGRILEAGFVKHYGKAISVNQWEDTCRYYSQYFLHFCAKWNARKGKAVHTQSDFGRELITWEEKETKGIPLTCEVEAEAIHKQAAGKQTCLRILLSNHQLLDYTGSEIFTYTVADYLKREGHEVTVYSRYVDKIGRKLASLGIRVVQYLEEIAGEHFDVAHVHHNINAMEVRNQFPNLPIVMVIHGVLPFLEQPPLIDLQIARYLAVSEEVREHLIRNGVKEESISIFRNILDSHIFTPSGRIRANPERALIVSSRLDAARESVIREALSLMGIEGRFVGNRFGEADPSLLPHYLNEADIVFSLGRGSIEAMLCGRVPIVFDYLGGDGMVTPENVGELMKFNFSGRKYRREYTVPELMDEIRKYDQENGERLRTIALEQYSADTKIKELIEIYRYAISTEVLPLDQQDNNRLISYINTVRETRCYMNNQLIRKYDREPGELSARTIPQPAFHGEEPDVMKAIRSLRDLIWLEPSNSEAHNKLGTLYYHQGEKEQALTHFRLAVEYDRENARASKNLSLLYLEMWPDIVEGQQQEQIRKVEAMMADQKANAKEQSDRLELQLAAMREELYLEKMKKLTDRIQRRGIRELVIYGAGLAGRALAKASVGAGIKIRCFVDKKESLWGSRIEDIEVLSLPQAMATGVHFYAIGSFSFVSEIKDEIRRAYAGTCQKPRILSAA